MIYDIIGLQKVDYDKKDGSGHVSGVNLFIASDIPLDRGQGVAVVKEYVNTSKFDIKQGIGKYDIEYAKGFNGNAYISKITKV